MKNDYLDIKDLSDSRELLEAKAPKSITIFISILLFVLLIGFTWCYFGKIDTYAVASGEIRTDEPSSTLSSLSTGKITSIIKIDGEIVKKDEVIMTIDSDYYQNQKDVLNKQKEDKQKKIDDYRLLIKSIKDDTNHFNKSNSLYYEYENYALELKETFETIDNSNNQLSNNIKEYDLLISQNINSKAEITAQINELNALIECVNNDTSYTGINSVALNTFNQYYTLLSPLQSQLSSLTPGDPDYDTTIASINSLKTSTIDNINNTISELNKQILSYDANIESYSLKKETSTHTQNKDDSKNKLQNTYYISINDAIESINNEIVTLNNELSKVDETLDSLSIKATSDGTLVYSKEYALGDTIGASEQVASIVPSSNIYKAVLYLPENKISEVYVGQDIEYIISSISLTDYGKVKGKIESISADSFSEQTSGTKYYKVISSIEKTTLINKKDKQKRILKVGMVIEGHIITGSQTILSYLLDKINFY